MYANTVQARAERWAIKEEPNHKINGGYVLAVASSGTESYV